MHDPRVTKWQCNLQHNVTMKAPRRMLNVCDGLIKDSSLKEPSAVGCTVTALPIAANQRGITSSMGERKANRTTR